jgi:hypothetical protein
MSNQYSMKGSVKPLKGGVVTSNYGNFETLTATNLQLENINIVGLLEDGIFESVIIKDSEIINTVIGAQSPNVGYFTDLYATQNVTFRSNVFGSDVTWDPSTLIFSINNSSFRVNGCSYLGNIEICENYIRATNPDGNINIHPKDSGSVYVNGPFYNSTSIGNFYTEVLNGSVILNSKFDLLFNSTRGSIISTVDSQKLITKNGDIELRTSNIENVQTSLINHSAGSTIIFTNTSSYVKVGDIINLSGVNLTVGSILSDTSFVVNSTISSTITGGTINKVANTNILLNTDSFVKIPTDTELIFGNTSNSISGNTGSLMIKSLGDTILSIPTSSSLVVPVNVPLEFGTFFNVTTGNSIKYDGSAVKFVANDILKMTAPLLKVDATNASFYDPILTIGDNPTNDLKDRGIEYKYYDTTGSLKLGWFGYKTSSQKFTFIRDATNTNETITGLPGEFEIGDISANNISIGAGGNFNMNCGSITNVSLLTGCSGTINVNATSNLNITSGNRIALIAGGDVFMPNNIPLKLGTSGSLIRENTSGTIEITANNNIKLESNSVSVPVGKYISFDGTSVGSQRISSNTSGDIILTSNKNIYLTSTSGNVILPVNNSGSFTSASLQLGNSTEVIRGNTSGISIMTVSPNGSANVVASGNVNVTSSVGNVLVQSLTSDINLYTTSGNVRLLPTTRVVFGISGTGNSIRSDTFNNMVLNGNTTNTVDIRNITDINLSASSGVNISSGTFLNLSSSKDRYIVGDTIGNIILNNSYVGGNTIISSSNMLITGAGNLSVRNTNTYISSSNMVISGSVMNIDMDNVLLRDRIITLGNETLLTNDNKDRGLEYKYYSSAMKLGWFGWKNTSSRLTYYSDAVNTNEVVTGTLGSVEFDSVYLKNNISFTSTGNIDMFCGVISNLSRVSGCTNLDIVVPNTVNISSGSNVNISSGSVINMSSVTTNMISSGDISVTAANILLNASTKVQVPYNVPLAFGSTSNSISADIDGNMTISVMGGAGRLVLNSDVQINGTTTNVYSTVTNLKDPIFSLGGVTGPLVDDGKDRGIEFKWNTGSSTKTGFFGYKNALSRFVFIQSGVNIDEVYSGSYGNVQFGNGYFNNLDVSSGTISNVKVISGGDISIVSSSNNLSLSSGSLNLPTNSSVNFGSTSNSISNVSSGPLNISSSTNVNFSMGSNKSITIPETVYLNMGSSSLVNTGGNLQISSSGGNIELLPKENVLIPADTFLAFGSTSNSIISNDGKLLINGYSGVSINTTTFMISGDLNIGGTVTAQVDANFDINKYILPLGTSQLININNIANYGTVGNVKISTVTNHNFAVGDSVILKSTNSVPVVDGSYMVTVIISSKEFMIVKSGGVSSVGSFGVVKSNLMTYQGKDVGIQVNYWSTVGNVSLTSGSLGYKTGFFGYKNDTQRWTYYNNASISNDVVTGTLSDIEVNKVFTNRMSGFALDGNVSAGSNVVAGSNFQIGGGSINGTTIGVNTAQTGRFTNLSNTVSANLSSVTLASSLAYTFERYTLSSGGLQTRSPTTTYAISLFSVSGPSYTLSSGTMPSNSASIPDGTLKILVCSSMGVGSSHTIFFGAGKLIAPNPLNVASQPTRLTFKRQGQSAHMVFDGVAGAWILLSNGVYVS